MHICPRVFLKEKSQLHKIPPFRFFRLSSSSFHPPLPLFSPPPFSPYFLPVSLSPPRSFASVHFPFHLSGVSDHLCFARTTEDKYRTYNTRPSYIYSHQQPHNVTPSLVNLPISPPASPRPLPPTSTHHCSDLFFSRPRSDGWPHHRRTFSTDLCHSD